VREVHREHGFGFAPHVLEQPQFNPRLEFHGFTFWL
jgi:hypothetical protein